MHHYNDVLGFKTFMSVYMSEAAKTRQKSSVSASERVYQYLRQKIIDMSLQPGVRIVEHDIAAELGVSRTPVHEAVKRLASESLIEVLPRAGTFVARIPLDTLEEAMVIRTALELAVTEFAAKRVKPQGVVRLKNILKKQRECIDKGDTKGFHREDEALHEVLTKIAGLPGMWPLILQAKVQVDRYRVLTLPIAGRMEEVWNEHIILVDAISTKNPDTAMSAMRSHLNRVLPAVELTKKMMPSYFTAHLAKPSEKR